MFPAQTGYPPAYQSGYNIAAQRSGPPPAKKPKGNPIITRYPPPPGYQGPVQPQAPYQYPAWPQTGQVAYTNGQVSYPGYSQQCYGAPQAYQQPTWPAVQQQQPFAPNGFHPAQAFPPLPNQVQPAVLQGYVSTAHHYPQNVTTPPSLPPPSIDLSHQAQRHNSVSFAGRQTIMSGSLDGNGDPLPPPDLTDDTGSELEHDFDAECYFARHPHEIDPGLSLGQIVWSAPQQVRRPLPGFFAEAELEAIAPRNPFPPEEESVSEYFVRSKRDETLLSVRQTSAWYDVKSDLIFREFAKTGWELLPRQSLIEMYRSRPDPDWTASFTRESSMTPDSSRSCTPGVKLEAGLEQHDSVMEVDSKPGHGHVSRPNFKSEQDDVLGDLEQAIFSTESYQPPDYQAANGHDHPSPHSKMHSRSHSRNHSRSLSRSYSRSVSVSSMVGQKITRPVPLLPVRDRNQEEVLAALGVTGEPRLVYQTPGPAFGAPPSQAKNGTTSHSRHGSDASGYGLLKVPPPPPQPARSPSFDPWNPDQHSRTNYGHRRAESVHSQQTAAGSDFHPEDIDATPRPTVKRTDSRKRGYEDDEDADEDGSFEPTPKPKKGKTQS